MHLTLDVPARVLGRLGDPQKSLRAILVGGTNGKGSVSQFAASILMGAGHRTGLYTSPHLQSVRERIRLNGENIEPEDLAHCLARVIIAQDELHARGEISRKLTYFEAVTLTAFAYFAEVGVDLAVLEVGLGGRLDATNLSDPLVSCITTIGLDHRDVLGQSIAEIAREKAAIGRPGRALWVGLISEEAEQAIRATAPLSDIHILSRDEYLASNDGTGRYRVQTVGPGGPLEFHLGVFGAHQAANAVLAVRLAESLQSFGIIVPVHSVRTALEATRIPGRLEKVLNRPPFFVDGGHNPPAVEAVARFIRDQFPEKVHLIFGMMRDKEIESCAHLLAPLCRTVFLTPIGNRRSATAEELQRFFPHDQCVMAASSEEATSRALSAAGDTETLVACGSLYLAGEIRALLSR